MAEQEKMEKYEVKEKPMTPEVQREPMSIEVKNLIVASMPKQEVVIGSPADIVAISKTRSDVKAIIWSEEELSLMLDDRSMAIRFEPEIDPMTKEFFKREKKSHYNDFADIGVVVWEGDYRPVRYTKANLLKFIATYEADVPQEVKDAIKALKIKQTNKTDSILISDEDGEGERIMDEEKVVTNLPKKFALTMPIAHGVSANLEFDAKVVRDNYGKGRPTIELRCTNGRQVLQDLMQGIVGQFPADLPRYYGRLNPGYPK
ncbi:MAG TPA: hypothetical protein VGB78_05460 [Thermoplasmata archaeon]|jgi:hypothetical protein